MKGGEGSWGRGNRLFPKMDEVHEVTENLGRTLYHMFDKEMLVWVQL